MSASWIIERTGSRRFPYRVSIEQNGRAELRIVVDSAERYPWRFPGATVDRRKLGDGDRGPRHRPPSGRARARR